MKTTITLLVLFLCISSYLHSQTAVAPSLGNGTSGNPYQIATWQNLYWITQSTDRWDDYYIQTADIDLTTADPAIATWDSNKGWTPIGNPTINFTGSYDGQNHFIKGLYINRPTEDNLGLFGYTGGTCSIQKLRLLDGTVTGRGCVGTLVGKHSSSGNITYCCNTGNVIASGYCIGGLVGENDQSTIEFCYNTGKIGNGIKDNTGPGWIGGLVGHNWIGLIRNCYNTGKIDGGYWGAGGLVGYNNTDGGVVQNCYSVGLVDAFSETDPIYGLYRIGGVVGDCCTYWVSNTFWDYETAGTTRGHGTPRTTAQMKMQSTFTGWDFTNVWEIVGDNYPRLRNNPDSALPVELNLFTARTENNSVILEWQTATEVNNYGFEIERAFVETQHAVSLHWVKIGFVQGHGNSHSPQSYTFVDVNALAGKVQYRLKQIDFDGKYEYSNVVEINVEAPTIFLVKQNYPNPFNPTTVISYQLSLNSWVTLKVFDILGKEVKTLVNEYKNAGTYNCEFRIENGELPSGIYFYRLTVSNTSSGSGEIFSQTKKLMLLK